MSVRLLIIASYLKEGRFMCKISCSLSCSNLFTHVWNAHTLYISELHATCTDLKRHTKSFDRQTVDNFLLQQTKYNLIKMQRWISAPQLIFYFFLLYFPSKISQNVSRWTLSIPILKLRCVFLCTVYGVFFV